MVTQWLKSMKYNENSSQMLCIALEVVFKGIIKIWVIEGAKLENLGNPGSSNSLS